MKNIRTLFQCKLDYRLDCLPDIEFSFLTSRQKEKNFNSKNNLYLLNLSKELYIYINIIFLLFVNKKRFNRVFLKSKLLTTAFCNS